MSKDKRRSAWPGLPEDLLLLALRRLASLADRVRAGAVCRSWRSAASQLPSTLLPWVVFGDGTLFDLANDNTPHPHYRLRLPNDCWRYSAGENMLFLVHQRDGSCSLVNALSGATTRLPELADLLRSCNVRHRKRDELRRTPHSQDQDGPMKAIGKVVVSSASASDDPIVAVLIERDVIVSTCRPAGQSNSCLLGVLRTDDAIDIVLFQGKIYALSKSHILETLELNNGHQGDEVKYSTELIKHPWEQHHQDFEDVFLFPFVEMYLVESGGKLLMVKRWVRPPCTPCAPDGRRTFRLEVWEADLSERRWKKLDGSLEGQALFVSRPCSMSLPAGHGVRQDCIYFLNRLYKWKQPEANFGDSGVYNIRDKAFTPLLQDSSLSLPWKSGRFPSWFFHFQV
ncbi:hypothetical protein ZWY2020_041660 [Hordeum vulgare]|nr:hypothetical protein ZWY2020_041660 [Hordeum vulgare]